MGASTPPSGDDLANALNVWEIAKTWGTPGVIIAAIAATWRGSRNYTAIRDDLTANSRETAALHVRVRAVEERQDTMGRDHTTLQVAVAALPTRSEMQAGFDSVRAEIRSERTTK